MAPDFDNDDHDVSDIERVLFCFAVEQEAKFFSYPGMEVIITGIGRENAERRLHSALHRSAWQLVLWRSGLAIWYRRALKLRLRRVVSIWR